MAVILKPGDTRRGYEIVRELSRGAFAISYEAKRPSGEKVFFKQYKSPSKLVSWHDGFVSYQNELKRRVDGDPSTRDKCYRFIDFFEERDFFQVFEFITDGMDLGQCIEKRGHFEWRQIVVFARVMMMGIKSLHRVKVVHTDLKPENIMLIPDKDIGGHRLRIVDMDWAIFPDRRAPWHGEQGYVGTAGYMSPEHLRTGDIPSTASDVFTCGLILAELLGGVHPYDSVRGDADGYRNAVLGGRIPSIKLLAPIDKVDNPYLEATLMSCLDPDPVKRPTAEHLSDVLLGVAKSESSTSVPRPVKEAVKVSAPDPVRTVVASKGVQISFNGRLVTVVSVDSDLGKQHFKSLDSEAQFLSNPQFHLVKRAGTWFIEHCASATNDTLIDGHALVKTEPVRDGMTIAVGNAAKGVSKFPLTLTLSS